MSSDDYARTIIATGHSMGITPRGIKIGLATALVEAGPIAPGQVGPILMYANAKVPESLKLPHDEVGSDGYSVGVFQQQIRKGSNGQWWWADCATCMDVAKSAALFFGRLAKLDYNGTRSPGSYAQAVQGSAFPDRYDQRFTEASALYDRLNTGGTTMPDYGITKVMHGYNASSAGIGNSNGPRARTPFAVFHTQQAKSTAVALANFCNGTATTGNPVAYNLSIDGRDTVEIVPLNEGPWAAADANDLGIHICIAGSFAEWSRGQWLDGVDDSGDGLNEDLAITRAAKALAAAHQQYGIPLVYAGDRGRSGWPIKAAGVVGHMDFGQRGGGHTDPGMGFPFDELIKRALSAGVAPVVPNLIDAAAAATPWVGARITKGENKLKDGAWAEFADAHIYWRSGAKAAYVIPHGGLFETWGADYQWETGPLGYPTRPFTKLDGGAVQAFEGGTLLRQDGASRGFYVHGAIGDQYKAMGWEESAVGYPTSDETPVPGTDNIVQHFEHGTLTYVPTGVKVDLTGKAA
ncbi:N-acetylmuramoyl-L-alanine amidase [Gordonia sp. SL306]|uniref:N-acetylmuramoyl-L-alanine amidase n=1 Tax=Gordonia sp. SL306 TaxID=2995145 RepID=UPI002271A695|nr:N-acetylmuramoyl-L-alanine amidase [Gordonia sp. SL306]WAC54975.1 N-acetylmuramoyl-L-alanine amidase [Gordonia sp. SL306]